MHALSIVLGLALLAPDTPAPPNILLVIADDLGVDKIGAYGVHPAPARTPVLAGMAAAGLVFENAYANPACSPTRATILTGRYSWRTGLGAAISGFGSGELQLPLQDALPEHLPPAYSSAAVGKWHLSNDPTHPQQAGFLHHWGSINSIPDARGVGDGYFDYQKNVDGELVHTTTYATTETVDDALTLIDQLPEPWFLWLAFNAPHVPFHKPPESLHTYGLPEDVEGHEELHAKAMIEAMDTELGRLLDTLDPAGTTVLFVGDNGSDPRTVSAPFDPTRVKGTLFEGGVRVPLIVRGPGVPAGGRCAGLVNTTDLFATIVELAGGALPPDVDSVSLAPYFADPEMSSLREHAYVETFIPNFDAQTPFPLGEFVRHSRAVRNERFKLFFDYLPNSPYVDQHARYLFDLADDPFEQTNLLAAPLDELAHTAYVELQARFVDEGPSNWVSLEGTGVVGFNGEPELDGAGPLVGGTPLLLEVRRTVPSTSGFLTTGMGRTPARLGCDDRAPDPTGLTLLATDPTGVAVHLSIWPSGLPPVMDVTFQAWIRDEDAPCGWAASNVVVGTTAP